MHYGRFAMGKGHGETSGRRFSRDWSEEHTLDDGAKVVLRRLRSEDRDALLAGFERLSPESRYLRFFTAMHRLPTSIVDQLMRDDDDHLAIVATSVAQPGAPSEGYGVARFIRLPDATDTAEAAVTVVDHMQKRGIGTLLLERLIDAARERGIRQFRAEILRGNTGIDALLHDVDPSAAPTRLEGPVAVYLLDLDREPAGPIFRLLQLAAGGLQVLIRHLPGWSRPGPPDA